MISHRVISILPMMMILVGIILIVDQLYLFGIPFGGFLGDLSMWDITGSSAIHHWMVGVGLVIVGFVTSSGRRRK